MASSNFSSIPELSSPSQRLHRMATRVAAIVPVELVFAGSRGGILTARTTDIGTSGLCVKTESPVDGDSIHLVRLKLGRQDLELRVVSRWSSAIGSQVGSLTGLEFEETDARSEAALGRFVQERAMEIGTFLRSCSGFDELGFQEALELAMTTRIREVHSGDIIFGAPSCGGCNSIFVLFRGSILLERNSDRRNQQGISVQPGEFFGGLPLIAGLESTQRAVATGPSTLLEFVDYSTSFLITHKPTLGAALLRATAFHWSNRTQQLLDRSLDASSDAPGSTTPTQRSC